MFYAIEEQVELRIQVSDLRSRENAENESNNIDGKLAKVAKLTSRVLDTAKSFCFSLICTQSLYCTAFSALQFCTTFEIGGS